MALTAACGGSGALRSPDAAGASSHREQLVLSVSDMLWVGETRPRAGPGAPPGQDRSLAGSRTITLALDPSPRAMGDAELAQWVATSATVVARYLGGWPVARALVFVAPGEAGKIDGETVDDRGGTIFLRVGRDVSLRVANEDWVLVHEMIHLVMPGLGPPHQWLEEGIATYVEPIARARAGVISESRVWAEWLASMPQGLPEATDEGLDHTHTWARTYWGGALYCLVADVEIRRGTHNGRSLDDALRAISRASPGVAEAWPVERFLSTGDAATGLSVLQDLYERMAMAPGSVDLAAMWRDLGVSPSGHTVKFDGGARLAYVRQAITSELR